MAFSDSELLATLPENSVVLVSKKHININFVYLHEKLKQVLSSAQRSMEA